MSESALQKIQAKPPVASKAQKAPSMRVIVVDDDPIFRSLAAAKFLHTAREIVEAEDGSVGWYRISTETFHLAVIDLDMPNMGGIDLIRCIRGHPRTAKLPVIVVTSRNPVEAMREVLESGATAFISKPVNWSMFSSHINTLFRLYEEAERGKQAEDALQIATGQYEAEIQQLRGEALALAQSVTVATRAALTNARQAGANDPLLRTLAALQEQAERAQARFGSGKGAGLAALHRLAASASEVK